MKILFIVIIAMFTTFNGLGRAHVSPSDEAETNDNSHSFDRSPSNLSGEVTFSGIVRDESGSVRYSRLIVYDPQTLETIVNAFVCGDGGPFSIQLPMGTYSVAYTPLTGFAQQIYPFEVQNVDMRTDVDLKLPIQEKNTPQHISDAAFTKNVLAADGVETAHLVAKVMTSNIEELYYLNLDNNLWLEGDDAPRAKFKLYDDGSHGDEQAGDGQYSSAPLYYRGSTEVGAVSGFRREGKLGWVLPLTFQIHIQGVIEGLRPVGGTDGLTFIDQSVRALPDPLIELDAGLYYNDDLINIVRPSGDNFLSDAKLVYRHFPDEFDFLFLQHVDLDSNTTANYFSSVHQEVRGIGSETYNHSQDYGSNGKLKGIVTFPKVRIDLPFNHELLHSWSFHMHELFNSGVYGAHAGYCSLDGVHGGFDASTFGIVDDTTVTVGRTVPWGHLVDDKHFSDLELYLMGLLPFEDLRDEFIVLWDPVPISNGRTRVSRYEVFGKDKIVATYGPRIPAAKDAQKDFHTAMVVVSDDKLSESEAALYTYFSRTWSGMLAEDKRLSFREATGNRGTMSTRIPSPMQVATTSTNHDQIVVYPNPSRDLITITSADRIKFEQVYIRDFAGKTVLEGKLADDTTLDISVLRAGIYVMDLQSDHARHLTKLIVIK